MRCARSDWFGGAQPLQSRTPSNVAISSSMPAATASSRVCVGGAVPDGRRRSAAALPVPVACGYGVPAVRRNGDADFAVP